MSKDPKLTKAAQHARDSKAAATRIAAAIRKGELPLLEDAKILEAAGCYIRRNAT